MTLGPTVAATQGTRTANAARGVAAPSGRSSERDVKGLWQTVSAALIGAILAGAGSWLTFGVDRVTRSELKEAVTEISAKQEREMSDLRLQLRESAKAQHDAAVEMARLSQRLSDLMARGK
jgi:hypothetical protein